MSTKHERNLQTLKNNYDRWKQTVPASPINDLNDDPPLEDEEKEEEEHASSENN